MNRTSAPDAGAQERPRPGLGADGAPRVLWAPRDLLPLPPDVAGDLPRYREWVDRREQDRVDGVAPPEGPEITLLVAVHRPHPAWLRQCLDAVTIQTTDRWRLWLATVGAPDPALDELLDSALGHLPEGRVARHRVPEGTPATALAAALEPDGAGAPEAFAVLGQHDRLAPDAVARLAAALAHADLAYADEDRTDDSGRAVDPVLKPDWSPELCLSWNYVGRPTAVRTTAARAVGGIREVAGGDWEHDLVLRVTEGTDRVAHVAEVLCHRRDDDRREPATGSGEGGNRVIGDRVIGDRAITAALARRGLGGTVVPGPLAGSWRIRRVVGSSPIVSVVIPFRDAPALLRTCVDSIVATSGGLHLDLLLVDNGSVEPETRTLLERLARRPDVTVLHDARPFNWAALNNAAAEAARGDLLLFLNNDIEAVHPGWLEALAAQALQPDVGAVGARLLYPTGRVQHAGVVVGMGGAGGHVLAGLPGDHPGYLGLATLTRDCSAVTGACLATRRRVFDDLDGFDESLGVDLNDIDYCLRAGQRGLRVVFEPAAELVHYESPSRGTSGSIQDITRFVDRWEALIRAGDPFLNRNLTRVDSSCALRSSDEEGWWQSWRSILASS